MCYSIMLQVLTYYKYFLKISMEWSCGGGTLTAWYHGPSSDFPSDYVSVTTQPQSLSLTPSSPLSHPLFSLSSPLSHPLFSFSSLSLTPSSLSLSPHLLLSFFSSLSPPLLLSLIPSSPLSLTPYHSLSSPLLLFLSPPLLLSLSSPLLLSSSGC